MATHVLASDFSGTDARTLSGKRGEEFTVLSETSGWSSCSNSAGKIGLLPSSYLKPLPALQPVAGDEYVEALHDFTNPQNDPRVVSFKAKDVMKVIKKTPGWWTCEIVSTGKTGMVPKDYVKPCSDSNSSNTSSPGPPVANAGESDVVVKPQNQMAATAAAAGAAAAAAAARRKVSTTALGPPSALTVAPSAVAPAAVAPLGIAPSVSSVSNTFAPPIGDDGKGASNTAPWKNDIPKVSTNVGGGDIRSSSSNLASKSVSGSDQDVASLLASFNTLQQEANTLLQKQMEELLEIKNNVKRIGQIVRDIHTS